MRINRGGINKMREVLKWNSKTDWDYENKQ